MTLLEVYDIKLNANADNLLDEGVYLHVHTTDPDFTHQTTNAQFGRFFMFGITVPS